VIVNEKNKKAEVYMKPDQVSLAIGKGGYNIKLAGKLTGYEIDIYRDADPEEEDVELDNFNDEIDQWIIDVFKNIGLDTAKSILALSVSDIMQRADLDEETVLEVRRILEAEFES
jgi:N utilization substance protein A